MTEVESNSGTKTREPKRRIGRWWALGVIALLFGWFCFYFLVPPSFDQEPMPEPNAYEYFIRAGNMAWVDRNLLTNDNELAWARPIYDSNQLALAEFRRGMEFECRVPRIPVDQESWESWFGEFRAVRELFVVLTAEAVVLRAEGHREQATRCDMEMIRFGGMTMRGGVVLNEFTSNNVIASGERDLHDNRGDLDAIALRKVCAELLEFDAIREPSDAVIGRDRRMERVMYSKIEDIPYRLKSFVDFESKRSTRFVLAFYRTRSRLLIVELALEAFLKERGAYPRELAELTPGLLKALPEDPFGNLEFFYARTAEGYLLYSVGPDGIDDGGALIDMNDAGKKNPKGDVKIERW